MLGRLIEREILDVDFPHFVCTESPFIGRRGDDDELGAVPWTLPLNIALLHWGDLYRALRSRVPNGVYQAGRRVTGFEQREGEVQLQFDAGQEERFDLVIFADGYQSLGRQVLFESVPIEYRGYVLWRGVVPERELSSSEPLEGRLPRLAYGDLPGHTVLYFVPGTDGSTAPGDRIVNWAAYVPWAEDALPDFLTDRNGKVRRGSLPPGAMRPEIEQQLRDTVFGRLPGYYARIAQQTHDSFAQPIYTVDMPAYHRGRVCLMGDAGAVAQPFTGSGVFKGVTNAIELVEALQQHDDADAALQAWDGEQVARGKRLVALGAQMEKAFIWEPLSYATATGAECKQWWNAAVTFPEDFTYAAR